MKRVALYTRVSTEQQAQKHGTAYQRRELHQLVEQRGWNIVGIFSDEGVSGRKRGKDRPGLEELLKLARSGKVDVVAVWKLDRMARSLEHSVQLLAELTALHVDLVIVGQSIDTTTPTGKALFGMIAIFAELEADMARERVAAGLATARANGVKLGRPPCKFTPKEVKAAVETHRGIRPAARALKISTATVQRYLRLADEETTDAV